MKIKIKFEPRDIWIGCYWNKVSFENEPELLGRRSILKIYICIIPMLPIIFEI